MNNITYGIDDSKYKSSLFEVNMCEDFPETQSIALPKRNTEIREENRRKRVNDAIREGGQSDTKSYESAQKTRIFQRNKLVAMFYFILFFFSIHIVKLTVWRLLLRWLPLL